MRVVHLVRAGNPLASLKRFLESYRRYDAGLEHRLVLLCKGFSGADELAPVLERLGGIRAQRIDVPDDGYDLTAYRRAAARLDGATVCYLNSNSVLLAPGWLDLLLAPLTPAVGMVGASGSWNSAHSNACYLLGIPGAYAAIFPDRAWYRVQSRRLADDGAPGPGTQWRSRPPLRQLCTAYTLGRQLVAFRRFPSRHVRTNAFAIRSETMARLRFPVLRTKTRAWQLESGRGSFTDQILAMGMGTLVIGRDGTGYSPPDWADSDTFWQADQDNLLVADNQTARYQRGDVELRTLLAKLAWGPQARPASPDQLAADADV